MALRLCKSVVMAGLRANVASAAVASRSFALDAGLKSKLEEMVKENKVVVFMKGVPEAPKCGFSNAVVQVGRRAT